jgi:hypothetical protein
MLCIACILTSQQAIAQHNHERCGTMEYLEKQKKADPTLEARMQHQEELLQQRIADMKNSEYNSLGKGKPVPPPPPIQSITIPVVVHILYNTPEQNIPDQRVFDQIAITNRDFAGLNPHSMGAFPHTLKSNTNIQFCLASSKIDGSPTNGIERRFTDTTEFTDNSMKFYNTGGLDAWDPTVYMNIWVCEFVGAVGYAQYPGTGINATYGAVIDVLAFGLTDTNFVYRGGGACATHELAHCMNLRHSWGDDHGSCAGSDYCADTPNQADATIGFYIISGTITDACSPVSPGIMYQNFMDYTRDIAQANFTPDQTIRMQSCFVTPSGPLVPLLSSLGCTPPNPCGIPTALTTTGLTQTTATLEWAAVSASTGYNIRYRKTNATAWTTTTSSTNSKYLTGLIKNTNYEFQVQNVCSASSTSNFSASCTFKTPRTGAPKTGVLEEPSAPTVLTISPNPVMSQSTIYYTLTEPSVSSITIVNALGAEIARLSSGQIQNPGTYSMQYDASRLIPGLYFVRFTTGRTIETAKFVIQR